MPVQHSLQGHPESGKMWMRLIDKVLINGLEFTSTVHDRCIYRKIINGKLVLLLRQVDDFTIACKDENIARKLTEIIGKKIWFKTEEEQNNLPIEFLGLVTDYNGVDIEQASRKIRMHAKAYLERFLQTHGWDTESDKEKNGTFYTKSMKSSKPLSPLSSDCLEQLFNHVGPKEHSPEALVLEKTAGFSYQSVLGELMYAYITCRPDIGYAITTLSKFSSAPSAFHYRQLRHVAKYVRSTIEWGIEFTRPTELMYLPPTVEHNDLPKLEEEFPIDINVQKLLVKNLEVLAYQFNRENS